MPYVSRDQNGDINGVMRWPPIGQPVERLAANHADVTAFRGREPKADPITAEEVFAIGKRLNGWADDERPRPEPRSLLRQGK